MASGMARKCNTMGRWARKRRTGWQETQCNGVDGQEREGQDGKKTQCNRVDGQESEWMGSNTIAWMWCGWARKPTAPILDHSTYSTFAKSDSGLGDGCASRLGEGCASSVKSKKWQNLLQVWVDRNSVYNAPMFPLPKILPRVLVVKYISKMVGEACTS